MERQKTPIIVAKPDHKRQSIAKPLPFSRISCRAWANAPTPRNNRHVNSMNPRTTNSTPRLPPRPFPKASRPAVAKARPKNSWSFPRGTPQAVDDRMAPKPHRSTELSYAIDRGGVYGPCDRPHSITSSARSRIDWGMVRPSAFAVLRLITSSNLVGCSTGRSAGFVPLRIRST